MELARVGPYELLRPLGAGGMAETFVAVRRGPARFEQRVCLKRILPGRAADPRFVELFLDEARLLAKLRNAAIVQVYDFGESDGTYYMALELVDGMDLEALLNALRRQGKRVPVALALYVAGQILSALHYADSLMIDGEPLQLVHRDISPSNVLVSQQGEVKLTDFGIAKARGRQHKTQTGHTKGKVAYMSPEQVRGDELDARSDLFAVGVVLYEMLSGIHPFDAPTDLTLLNNILSGNCRPLSELIPDLPSSVVDLVKRLLSVERGSRPANAGDALLMVSVFDQPFALQRQLAALVTELRPVVRESVRPPSSGANDGATELWRDKSSPDGQPATPAKGTSELSLHRRRSKLPWAMAAGTLFLAGLVALGLWWNEQQTLPPPVVTTQLPDAPLAPAAAPAPEVAPALPLPAEAARPSTDVGADAGEEDSPHGPGLILHRPSGVQQSAPPQAPRNRPVHRRSPGASEQNPKPPAPANDRGSKTRSGASVSVDDF